MSKPNDALLPCRVDDITESDPLRIYAEIPTSDSSYDLGFTPITYKQLANAINGAAWWLEDTVGVGHNFETLAYSGSNNLRYPIIVLGAVKAGYKILLISPRNSLAAQSNLLKLLECSNLIVSDPELAHVKTLTANVHLQTYKFPDLLSLLNNPHKHYPYIKTYEEAKSEPLVVVHTSGSTGLPKPLIIPHAFAAQYANVHQAEPLKGFVNQASFINGIRLIHTLPMFHAAGIYRSLISTILSKTILIIPRPNVPSTGEEVGKALKCVKADAAFLAPSQVEEVGKNPELLHELSTTIDTIYFAGGAVPKSIGDVVASKIRLASLYGSSEMGQGAQLRAISPAPDEDWSYLRWNTDLQGIEFREEAQGLYQMIVVKDPERADFQAPFTIFPNLTEFATKDLFSPHPSILGLWRHAGRSDDVIVLLNGEKTNPVTMEGQISSHPKVRSALIAGDRRLQTALLIELVDGPPLTAQGRAELIEELWHGISIANLESPAHACVTKDRILFVKPDKPMIRAGKGTVVRQATLKAYAKEIDALYEEHHSLVSPLPDRWGNQDINTSDSDCLSNFVIQVVKDATGWTSLGENDDFFKAGMDSLQAIQLTRHLKARLASLDIIVNMIYRCPSVSALTQAIMEMASHEGISHADQERFRVERISSVLERHINTIDSLGEKQNANVEDPAARRGPSRNVQVLLTGSSGFVGSHVLRSLVREPTVTRIFCLSRPRKETASRKSQMRSERVVEPAQDRKVVQLGGELDREEFGMRPIQYQELRNSINMIIHAAWAVDFNLGLSAYEDQLEGLVNLILFSQTAPHSPTILFVSSISSIQHCPSPVSETTMADKSAPASTGYGESKYIAEQLLEHAARAVGQSAMIVRAGQICGPTQGHAHWNRNEWLPSLVVSSNYLGAIPASLSGQTPESRIDWVPVDYFADVLVELSLYGVGHSGQWEGAKVLHVVHPRPITWKSLLPTIIQSLERRKNPIDQESQTSPVATIPFREWAHRLEASSTKGHDEPELENFLDQNPAIKLLAHYQRLARGDLAPELDTLVAQGISASLRDMESIKPEMMERWVQDWLPAAMG